tara:strand:+ start:138 stop:506 length:369 start_codon:yes stop_codon:yes gene_type:complete
LAQRTDLKRVCKQRTNLRMNAGLKYKQTPEFIDDERREMRHRAKLEGGGGEKFEAEQASIQKLKREKSVKEEYYIDKVSERSVAQRASFEEDSSEITLFMATSTTELTHSNSFGSLVLLLLH